MTVRTFLYLDGTNQPKQMDTGASSRQQQLLRRACYLYYNNPSVTLTKVDTGGNLSPTMIDSRRTAGAAITGRVSSYAPETTTEEPGTVTVNYDRVNQTIDTTSQPSDVNSIGYLAYYSNGGIYAASWQDMVDTIFQPCVVGIQTSTLNGVGISTQDFSRHQYFTRSTYTETGFDRVSNDPIYVDTRADTSLYTAAGIPEALDQPQTINNYYLKLRSAAAEPTVTDLPLVVSHSDGRGVKQITSAALDTLLEDGLRHYAASTSGLRYEFTTDSTLTGAQNSLHGTMVDTKLDGSGNYQTRLASADDYRSQEFPNGNAVTARTYRLYLKRLTA